MFGGYQYYGLRGSVQDTVQEILTEYPGVTVDGINLHISVIFANKVTVDVFIQRENDDVLGDDVVIIEASIIPNKNAIPILSIFIDFDSLDLFLADEENIISHQYSNLVLYIDSINTNIYSDTWVYLTSENNSAGDEILITKKVSSLSDSIEISMGHILRGK